MKHLLILSLLLVPLIATAVMFELTPAAFDSLRAGDGVDVVSQREKRGETVTETWSGVMLDTFVAMFDNSEWAQVVVTSPDNYQVRIPAHRAGEVIVAWARDGEPLPEPRVVWPGEREMHWVRNPCTFETRTDAPMPMPQVVRLCQYLRDNVPLRKELPPFTDATGYRLADLAQHVFPLLRDEFLTVGRDGVRHTFDWAQFLDKAVLLRGEAGLDLQSVDMPGGMWIKDLVWVQQDDTALLMLDRFDNWHDIVKLLGWPERPETITVTRRDGEQETIPTPEPGDEIWRDVVYFTF